MNPQIISIALFLVLSGPVTAGEPESKAMIESLRWVEAADPIKDADQAFNAKDYRFQCSRTSRGHVLALYKEVRHQHNKRNERHRVGRRTPKAN
jgi:hypothetical protein